MSDTEAVLPGNDFAQGISVESIAPDDMLLGHAHGEAVLLARRKLSQEVQGRPHLEIPRANPTVMEPRWARRTESWRLQWVRLGEGG